MKILSTTSNVLASRGNVVFLVLVDYKPLYFTRRNKKGEEYSQKVYVKLISKSGQVYPAFGVFDNVDGNNEFVEYSELTNKLIEKLLDPRIHKFSFDKDVEPDEVVCNVNEGLRLINYTRPVFEELVTAIYRNNTTTPMTSNSMTLSVEDVKTLYDYFENYFATAYVTMFNERILTALQRSSINYSLRSLIALKQFVPILFRGNCLINPFLDCGKFSKVFTETKLFNTAKSSTFELKDNVVYLLTNKEICECFGLDRFIAFSPTQLIFIILGIFNPSKYPSTERYVYIANGKVYNTTDALIRKGIDPSQASRVSSLYALCLSEVRTLGIKNINEYVEILSSATLL